MQEAAVPLRHSLWAGSATASLCPRVGITASPRSAVASERSVGLREWVVPVALGLVCAHRLFLSCAAYTRERESTAHLMHCPHPAWPVL